MNALPVFKALSDPTRLRILSLLLAQELNVNEIVRILRVTQSGISRHLKIMSECGLIRSRRDGLWSFFSAASGEDHAGLMALLSSHFEDLREYQADRREAKKVLAERDRQARRLFDSLAPAWEEMKKKILGSLALNAEIIRRIPASAIVADLGCGTGDLLQALAGRAEKVIGVDSSPEMIRRARSRFSRKNGSVDVRMGEFEHLPLADREADSAICNMVLHHLPEPGRGILEVERILRSGGRFVLTDFSVHNSEIMRTKYGDRWLGFDQKNLENWLGSAGFQIIDTKSFPVKNDLTVLLISAVKNK